MLPFSSIVGEKARPLYFSVFGSYRPVSISSLSGIGCIIYAIVEQVNLAIAAITGKLQGFLRAVHKLITAGTIKMMRNDASGSS